jgi:hypothetical protein
MLCTSLGGESETKLRCQSRTGIPMGLDRVINTPERNS